MSEPAIADEIALMSNPMNNLINWNPFG